MTFPEHKMVDSAATVDLLTLFVLQPTMKPSTQEHKIYIHVHMQIYRVFHVRVVTCPYNHPDSTTGSKPQDNNASIGVF